MSETRRGVWAGLSRLQFGDERQVRTGVTHEMKRRYTLFGNHEMAPTLCVQGMHAANSFADCILDWGELHAKDMYVVDVWGELDGDPTEGKKFCGRYRKYVRKISMKKLCKELNIQGDTLGAIWRDFFGTFGWSSYKYRPHIPAFDRILRKAIRKLYGKEATRGVPKYTPIT